MQPKFCVSTKKVRAGGGGGGVCVHTWRVEGRLYKRGVGVGSCFGRALYGAVGDIVQARCVYTHGVRTNKFKILNAKFKMFNFTVR